MVQIFVPYKDKNRLQRMAHLAPKHKVEIGLQDYNEKGFVDLTGDRSAIYSLIHEVDHPVLQVKP